MRCKQEDRRLVIKNGVGEIFLYCWILSIFVLGFIGSFFIHAQNGTIAPPKDLKEFFLIIFCLAGIFFFGYVLLLKVGYELTVDADGIRESRKIRIKRCRSFRWEDVSDWGCSYVTSNRGRGVYTIYFADIVLPMRDQFDKKADKECIQIIVNEKKLKKLYPILIPFCRRYTSVVPFCSVLVKNIFEE